MLVDEVVVSIIKKRMSENNINPMSCSDTESVEPSETNENIRKTTEFNDMSGFCIFTQGLFTQKILFCH